MTDSLPTPYKAKYPLSEVWPMFTRGTIWKTYKLFNKKEAAFLDLHAQRKIAQEADFIPVNQTHTFTGNAILMAILTLPA